MDTEINDEREWFFSKIKDMTYNSERTYRNKYNQMVKAIGLPVMKMSVEDFAKFSKKLNPNTASTYLVVISKVRQFKGEPTDDFINWRRENLDPLIQRYTKKVNNYINENVILPTVQQLQEHENKWYSLGKWNYYIAHFLINHYFTRNLDVNVKIVKNLDETNDKDNFLVIKHKPNQIIYIRNDYKTVWKYGTKTFIIKDRKFFKAVNEQLKTSPYLVADHDDQNKFYRFLQYALFPEMNEGLYLKVHIKNIKDKTDLLTIAERRGTSEKLLLTSYNLEYPGSDQVESNLYKEEE